MMERASKLEDNIAPVSIFIKIKNAKENNTELTCKTESNKWSYSKELYVPR